MKWKKYSLNRLNTPSNMTNIVLNSRVNRRFIIIYLRINWLYSTSKLNAVDRRLQFVRSESYAIVFH